MSSKTARKHDREFLTECASALLEFIGTLDPSWADRIEITRTERHFDDLQIIGAYVGSVLDRGEHLLLPEHTFFMPGFVPPHSQGICPACKAEYKAQYPGQPLCGKPECAEAYYAKLDAKVNEQAAEPHPLDDSIWRRK